MTWDALIYLHLVNILVFCPKPLELDFELVSRFPLRTQNSCLFQQNRNSSQMSAVLPQHWIPRQLYWHAKYSESSPQPCQHRRVTARLGGVDLQVPFVDTHIWLGTPEAADGEPEEESKAPRPFPSLLLSQIQLPTPCLELIYGRVGGTLWCVPGVSSNFRERDPSPAPT